MCYSYIVFLEWSKFWNGPNTGPPEQLIEGQDKRDNTRENCRRKKDPTSPSDASSPLKAASEAVSCSYYPSPPSGKPNLTQQIVIPYDPKS